MEEHWKELRAFYNFPEIKNVVMTPEAFFKYPFFLAVPCESYTIPEGKSAGTTEYYYCVVTATYSDNGNTSSVTIVANNGTANTSPASTAGIASPICFRVSE